MIHFGATEQHTVTPTSYRRLPLFSHCRARARGRFIGLENRVGSTAGRLAWAFLLVHLSGLHVAPASADAGRIATTEPCPSHSFSTFLRRFSESEPVQRSFTYFPLETSRLIEGKDEPKEMRLRILREDASFPLYPAPSTIASLGLSEDIQEYTKSAEVIITKADTDYLVTYHFVKTDCWYLSKKVDESL